MVHVEDHRASGASNGIVQQRLGRTAQVASEVPFAGHARRTQHARARCKNDGMRVERAHGIDIRLDAELEAHAAFARRVQLEIVDARDWMCARKPCMQPGVAAHDR